MVQKRLSRTMISRAALFWFAVIAVSTAPSASAIAAGAGYTDTPMLPGGRWHVHDCDRPQPPRVEPGADCPSSVPSDAVVLFGGKDLSRWSGVKDATVKDGCFDIFMTGQISTRESFGDCQLHIEWQVPANPDADAMHWGNSGVFLLGLYEVQIIESRAHQIYADGIAGAIYGQAPPLVNASRPPGEWQAFDIVFTAPRFDAAGTLLQPAIITVLQNGILVQNHVAAEGPTQHRKLADYSNHTTSGPVMLQFHDSHVRFKNIWIRPINSTE